MTKHLQESIEIALLIFRKSFDLHLVLKFGIVDLHSVLELGSVDLHSVLELGSVDLYSVLGFCNFAHWTKPNRDRLQKCRSGHSIVFRSPFSLVVGLFAFDPRPSYHVCHFLLGLHSSLSFLIEGTGDPQEPV